MSNSLPTCSCSGSAMTQLNRSDLGSMHVPTSFSISLPAATYVTKTGTLHPMVYEVAKDFIKVHFLDKRQNKQ